MLQDKNGHKINLLSYMPGNLNLQVTLQSFVFLFLCNMPMKKVQVWLIVFPMQHNHGFCIYQTRYNDLPLLQNVHYNVKILLRFLRDHQTEDRATKRLYVKQ